MTLAQRDLYLVRIENEMENKKNFYLKNTICLEKWKKKMNI